MKKKSKRYKEILKNAVKGKKIATKEILDLVKKNKFLSVDMHKFGEEPQTR